MKAVETPRKHGLTVVETANCLSVSIILSAGQCLTTGSLASCNGGMRESRFIMFANFRGVNTLTKADMSMNTELGGKYMQLALMSLLSHHGIISVFHLLIGGSLSISSGHMVTWLETTFPASLNSSGHISKILSMDCE